ncbi:MAG: glycosyltransferase [Clostridia bacterium]|jgi:GT2 family glycosyltransferase|nr:glycosyltransferase [Clostridia bacterium]
MKSVDIIVPVYNAYEFTEECIKSVIRNTDLNKHTLILINDKSPDEKIFPMLKKYQEENTDKNIEVLDNEENLGFVGTVNKGMSYSKNDVILLNSDTEVTKNWVEKIQKCAYSNKYIATVTPLTNNGTICSVPNFGIDNELPKNMTLEEYAEMIEKSSKNRYPQLTTGNGFCMYIKREVIKELGIFDAETFGKGYGEENDFCYRALDHGYINVLCDNTFIYHKGTQSFKKENMTATRAALIEEHMGFLRKKHPIYVQKTDNFIANNPIRDIQENININIKLYGKKRILYLVNEWEENMEMTGGTSLHIKDIIKSNMKNNIASFVIAPDKYDLPRFKLYLYTDEYAKEIANYKTDIQHYGQIVYTNNSYKEMLQNIFDSFSIDVLHVHHFLFQTFDAIEIAKKRKIFSIITLHDLYMICPSINMIYKDKYCEYDKTKDCAKCLNIRYGVNSNILTNWQTRCKQVLKEFDKIIVPSENTKKLFDKVYKDLPIEVVEHGVIISKPSESARISKYFNIAFVGSMAIHKGSNILKELIKVNKKSNIKIHLFGKSEDRELARSHSSYINHGKYTRGELPQLLIKNDIDLVCIFATWPETYSYTLTECYMAQIPVITFNIGAVGDRVKKDGLGWTIDINSSAADILNKIEEISKNREEYREKKNNYEKYEFKPIEEMQEYYNKLYENADTSKEVIDVYQFMDYRRKSKEQEFNQYRALYGHVVHRYETMRRTKIWKVAKKLKGKLRGR